MDRQNLSPTRNISQNSFQKLLAQVRDRSVAIITPQVSSSVKHLKHSFYPLNPFLQGI